MKQNWKYKMQQSAYLISFRMGRKIRCQHLNRKIQEPQEMRKNREAGVTMICNP